MQTRCALWLDGQGLHDLDERIIITDIREDAPRMTIHTAQTALGDGSRLIRRSRLSLSVTVTLLIREYGVARRKQLCDAISAWADREAWLTTSDRPHLRLRVRCDTLPAAASALRWTDALTIIFTAYEQPFWQDEQPLSVHANAAANTPAELFVRPRGTASCRLEAKIINTGSAPATALTLSLGEERFSLSGNSLIPAQGTLTIRYDDHGLLTIRLGDVSLLHTRSADSCDELLMQPCQPAAVTVLCDQPLSVNLYARGLYL